MEKKNNIGHPVTSGATIIDIYKEQLKRTLGKILNYCHIPGFVKPIDLYDDLTKTHIKVWMSGFFTVISINGRDYYFKRLTGKFDGTGMVYRCSNHPTF